MNTYPTEKIIVKILVKHHSCKWRNVIKIASELLHNIIACVLKRNNFTHLPAQAKNVIKLIVRILLFMFEKSVQHFVFVLC